MNELAVERDARTAHEFRRVNERIARVAIELAVDARVPFVCECEDRICRNLIWIALADYRDVRATPRRFLIGRHHPAPHADAGHGIFDGDGYRIVEKTGRAGSIAEALAARERLD